MIPDQLTQYPLIRVTRHDSSRDRAGKRPVTSTDDDDPINRIKSWINRGGNYGTVARSDNDLVIFDSDSEEFSELLSSHLPNTFRVESGGSGHGEHWYYRCPSATRQTGWEDPEGSVRVNNWHAVGPGSIHPDTGEKYTVISDTEIATVTQSELTAVYEILDDFNESIAVQSGGGGTGGTAPSAHSAVGDGLDFIRRDDRRNEIAEILTTNSEHSRRVWMVGWLHAAAGLSVIEITDLIMNTAQWSDLDRSIVKQQTKSVINSSRSDRGTHYSKFGTADMDGDTSERRKMEESGKGRTLQGGENMSIDYNDHEEVTIIEGTEDGDNFKKVTRTTREEDDETVDFVSIKRGRIESVETVEGETVLARRVTDSTSIGSPDYLEELAEALLELDKKINE